MSTDATVTVYFGGLVALRSKPGRLDAAVRIVAQDNRANVLFIKIQHALGDNAYCNTLVRSYVDIERPRSV